MSKIKGTVIYRGHNGYDVKEASDDAVLPAFMVGESLTVQSQAEDADLNVLMDRFGITGRMPENIRLPEYGDFSHVTDYRSALEAVRDAHENFMEIPAKVRARFDNDPQQYMDFVANPNNIPEMRELGIFNKAVENERSSGVGGGAGQGNRGSNEAPKGGTGQDGRAVGGSEGTPGVGNAGGTAPRA